MTDISFFKGFIRDVRYKAYLDDPLPSQSFDTFDINAAKSFGQIEFQSGQIGYSKWISPKRTRSYPFARLYNIYNAPVRMTVIPILKDEGADGDNDRIQYSTFSWMNLLNIYIVLGYYIEARKNQSATQKHRNKLTGQKLDAALVQSQMAEVSQYKQSALHWNRSLFQDHFVEISRKALASYDQISHRTKVPIHDRKGQLAFLEEVVQDFESFRNLSLRGSKGAALREVRTAHGLEYLGDGAKAALNIENYLGGVYHLTVDEIVKENKRFVLQESKNTSIGFLPCVGDIRDGLFRLILYSNLDSLTVNEKPVPFVARLNLTGKTVQGAIRFPCSERELVKFTALNAVRITHRQRALLDKLNLEASKNRNLEIEIKGNH